MDVFTNPKSLVTAAGTGAVVGYVLPMTGMVPVPRTAAMPVAIGTAVSSLVAQTTARLILSSREPTGSLPRTVNLSPPPVPKHRNDRYLKDKSGKRFKNGPDRR